MEEVVVLKMVLLARASYLITKSKENLVKAPLASFTKLNEKVSFHIFINFFLCS
jgi:hypothetical protein